MIGRIIELSCGRLQRLNLPALAGHPPLTKEGNGGTVRIGAPPLHRLAAVPLPYSP